MPTEHVVDAALARLRAGGLVAVVSRREPLLVVGGWGERWADGLHIYDEPFTISEKGADLYFAGVAVPERGQLGERIEDKLDHVLHFVLAVYRRQHPAPVFESFDAYVRAHPQGEDYRHWVTGDGNRHDLALLPADPDQGCQMPGGYNWATFGWHLDADGEARWYVLVHDCDDGCCRKYVATVQEAKQEFANLKLMVPFKLYELREFGYQPE